MMSELAYLKAAESMDWHLLDFCVDPDEFAEVYGFTVTKPYLLVALASYRSFKEWPGLKNVAAQYQVAVQADVEAILTQACQMNRDMDPYDIMAYIDVNEYATYCFGRLAVYIDNFYINEEF